jgi:hypothetical protein
VITEVSRQSSQKSAILAFSEQAHRVATVELRNINKTEYKRRLNRLQGGAVIALLLMALGFSELYRALWSHGESSTLLNAAAVITAALILAGWFQTVKHQPWLADIRYTWNLKQELNRIYRRSRKLEAALAENNPQALCIQYFSLHGSRHLYTIEDNTLTLPELNEKIAEFDQRLQQLGLHISVADYHPDLLDKL